MTLQRIRNNMTNIHAHWCHWIAVPWTVNVHARKHLFNHYLIAVCVKYSDETSTSYRKGELVEVWEVDRFNEVRHPQNISTFTCLRLFLRAYCRITHGIWLILVTTHAHHRISLSCARASFYLHFFEHQLRDSSIHEWCICYHMLSWMHVLWNTYSFSHGRTPHGYVILKQLLCSFPQHTETHDDDWAESRLQNARRPGQS